MTAILAIANIVAVAATGLTIGIVLNSRNTVPLVNATGRLITGSFEAAASTIR